MKTKQKRKSRFSCCGCFSIIFIGVLLLVLVPAPLLQLFAAPRMHAAIAETYPPPGQIYDVEGAQMHIYCEGQGSQTVIVMNDMSSQSLEWGDVQAKLAGDARVCLYDRLGHDWSGVTSRKRSAENIADELDGLVKAAGIAPGFVLVGDAEGSLYARMFAWRHPDQAGALLLINALAGPADRVSAMYAPVVIMGLGTAPLFSFNWVASDWVGVQNEGVDCPSWMDNSDCDPWRAWSVDAYTLPIMAFEALSIETAWRSLMEPQIQYGDLPIVILDQEQSALADFYNADILGRTTNGRIQIVPGDTRFEIHESLQSFVDAVKALLH
jgi:pimeloyl-ACP methyl ester carboxylesterase